MTEPTIVSLVGYLTPIEDLEIDGRRFEIQYNHARTDFQVVVDGQIYWHRVLTDLRALIYRHTANGAENDRRTRGWLEEELAYLNSRIVAGSASDDFFGITLGDRRAIALERLAQLREREWLRGDIASCRDFLARLPETHVIERHGFEHKLRENLERLNAMDAAQTARQLEERKRDK